MKRKKKNHIFCEVEIPHLGYTVFFQDLSYLQGIDIKGPAYTVTTGKHASYVFITDIKETVKIPYNFPLIAHEIIHVLQNICRDRMMNFEEEKEHMAYLTAYILNKLLGYEYAKNPT